MKRILFMLTMLSVMSLTCAADYTYPYITFVKADGQSMTFSASGITMTPQSGVLTVNSDSGTETFTISELSKMYFSQDTPDAITAVNDAENTNGKVQLYTVSGQYIGQYASVSAAQKAMQQGVVYVVKTVKETMKGVKK